MNTNMYEVLGVGEDASMDEIKTAYRRAAMKYHPDRHHDVDDAAKRKLEDEFKRVADAFALLSDPVRKEAYDRRIRPSAKAKRPSMHADDFVNKFVHEWSKVNPNDSSFSSFDDMLRDTYASKMNSGTKANTKMLDVRSFTSVTMAEVFTGITKQVKCLGSDGKEQIRNISIPKNVANGTVIKYLGGGITSTTTNHTGDLYVTVDIDCGPWSIKGYDLHYALPISVLSLVAGSTERVTTVDGTVLDITVRPGTELGTKIRIANKGLQGETKRGDMYLDLRPFVPKLDESNDGAMALVRIIREMAK